MSATKKMVLTGFDTWGQNTYNSSWEILRDAKLKLPNGWQYETLKLPVSWVQAPALLESRIGPDVVAVVCFGMTGGQQVLVERIAANLIVPDLAVVDNRPHTSELVCQEGPAAYWTGLPFREICTALRQEAIPCDQNQWAGPHAFHLVPASRDSWRIHTRTSVREFGRPGT
jgi:pyroglutamyl-peptidase